jgi:hypothetical protein
MIRYFINFLMMIIYSCHQDIDHSPHLESCRNILGISKNDLQITECTEPLAGSCDSGP